LSSLRALTSTCGPSSSSLAYGHMKHRERERQCSDGRNRNLGQREYHVPNMSLGANIISL
jgi:hypothetical protein